MIILKVCTNTPIPDIQDLKDQINSQIDALKEQIPTFNELIEHLSGLKIPNLMIIKDQIYAGYSNLVQEINEIIDGVKIEADMLSMLNIYKPLIKVLGGVIEDFIPKIPVFNISIVDIINGKLGNFKKAIMDMIEKEINIPFVPLPLFENFKNIAKEAQTTLKLVITSYKQMVLDVATGMIKKVLDILEISATIPSMLKPPTLEELKDLVLEAFPDYKSWYELITSVSMDKILGVFSAIPLPNFPKDFEKKEIAFYSNFEELLVNKFNQIIDNIIGINIKTIIDFVENTLGQLGFEFPTFCVELM